ncbi:hypothetical protein HK104_009381 [Borealophlyctis nickersoniae]|nr:hypothetical protein HK104_009381 [Borealophlyctis nickersoniae]
MVGPLAKLMKVPDPIRKWNILQTSDIPSKLPNITELDVYGPLAAVAVYEETLAIPFDSVVNRPYGYAHTGWYFRRRTTDSKRFNIYPATNGEYQTPYMGLEERMKVLEDSSAELRELLLAEFLEVHESQTNVRNDGGANMGWAKVSDKVTEGEDQQLRAIRVENLLKG